MKYRKFDNTYIVRIDKNEEILEQLKILCQTENITLGSVTGIGATNDVEIGLFDTTTKKYNSITISEPLEITSLVGNISTMNGELYFHLHINVGDKNMNTRGGHLNKAIVSATCELIVEKINGSVDREFSQEIGLNLYKF